jgi:hypothetical protein
VVGALGLGTGPAGATTRSVGSQAGYRDALEDLSTDVNGPHRITLTADITITGATDPLYTGAVALTIDGGGHTLDGGDTRRVLASQGSAPLTIEDLHVIDGFSADRGGAIFSTGPLTITDSGFEGNNVLGVGPAAGSGGAAYVTNGGLTVTRSTFTGNHADGLTGNGTGGALTAVGASPTEITDSTFDGNTATGDDGATGGALHAPTEVVDVAGSTFTANTLDGGTGIGRGGALLGATVTVTNSTLDANRVTATTSEGGGVYAFAAVSLRHATVTDNAATTGSAVAVQGAVTTEASVLTSDALSGDECSTITPTISAGRNYAADSSCDLTGDGDVEDGAVPVVDPLELNGGPTPTRRPRAALIDAVPTGDCAVGLTTDQRGRPRPEGAGCDIGAVEAGYAVDALVRRGRPSPFRGDGIVNLDGTDQTLRIVKPRGYEAVFVVRIENDGEFEDSYRVRARRGNGRFIVRYRAGGVDVTGAVVAGTFETPVLEPGQFRVIRARVRVGAIAPHGVDRVLPARATSVAVPSRADVVKLVVGAR